MAITSEEAQRLAVAAAEADRLRQDPAFQNAIRDLRSRAIEALVVADATDTDAIRARQADIKAIDGFCQELANAMLRAPRKPMAVA